MAGQIEQDAELSDFMGKAKGSLWNCQRIRKDQASSGLRHGN